MKTEELEKRITEACDRLYREEKVLIDTKTHERTIAAHLVSYLKPLFQDWAVDAEYNREGRDGKPKRDSESNLLRPDITIHTRQSIEGPNLAAIQMKGFWNKEDRGKDENDLRKLKAKYNYSFLYRLELGKDHYELVSVSLHSDSEDSI
jgi:hypothetical protein